MKEKMKKALELMETLENSGIDPDKLKEAAIAKNENKNDTKRDIKCLDNEEYENIINNYRYGDSVNDINFREMPESVIDSINVCNPNPGAIMADDNMLTPCQRSFIKEMREKNALMSELMTEMYRRDTSRLLEYITQCISNIAKATNTDMCKIVDDSNDIES